MSTYPTLQDVITDLCARTVFRRETAKLLERSAEVALREGRTAIHAVSRLEAIKESAKADALEEATALVDRLRQVAEEKEPA